MRQAPFRSDTRTLRRARYKQRRSELRGVHVNFVARGL
jgi:hypothetical protein